MDKDSVICIKDDWLQVQKRYDGKLPFKYPQQGKIYTINRALTVYNCLFYRLDGFGNHYFDSECFRPIDPEVDQLVKELTEENELVEK